MWHHLSGWLGVVIKLKLGARETEIRDIVENIS